MSPVSSSKVTEATARVQVPFTLSDTCTSPAALYSAIQPTTSSDGTLVPVAAAQHRGERLQEDLQIESEGPVVDVLHVGLDPVLELRRVPVHLPEAGHAGPHAEAPLADALVDARHVARRQGTRADQTHVALDDVHELRQLIDAHVAQPAPHARHAR